MQVRRQIADSIANENKAMAIGSGVPESCLFFGEIDDAFRCPVVGLCLTRAEQKKLLRKSGIQPKNRSHFEIHETLVAGGGEKNKFSPRLDRLFRLKARAVSDLVSTDIILDNTIGED